MNEKVYKVVLEWIENNSDRLIDLSRKIWSYAELAFEEIQSSKLLADTLEREGFCIERGVAGIPTAFVATYGKGNPTIGFIGEYDALPGLSQKISTKKEPLVKNAPGHGCGHNLLGVASLGAALATKEAMDKYGIKGSLKYFGCPAEENGASKVYMVRDGVFTGTDAIIGWHPWMANYVIKASSIAAMDVKFRFTGQAAHAAMNPHLGRSALDACILMDVGVNYLREHIIPDARIHSVITDGGQAPNIVPDSAEIHYIIRAPRLNDMLEIYNRVVDIARGAALMNGVAMEKKFMSAMSNSIMNKTLSSVLEKSLFSLGDLNFTREDYEFAQGLSDGITKEMRCEVVTFYGLPESVADGVLHNKVTIPDNSIKVLPVSGDSADVSWIVPMARFFTACQPLGIPGHSWQQVASSGHSIGHKGMLFAVKAMALSTTRLLREPELVAKAKAELKAFTQKTPYVCPIPNNIVLPPQMP